ncbi:hypothetical protein [Candidatus Nitrosocosmicus franklandus]|nr:hypothetical protein [Candidatus Nitrosocosmicus franklandus]
MPIIPYFLVKTGLIDIIDNFTALMTVIWISLGFSFKVGTIKGDLSKKSLVERGLESDQ